MGSIVLLALKMKNFSERNPIIKKNEKDWKNKKKKTK